MKTFQQRLRGYDVDKIAVDLARDALWQLILDRTGRMPSAKALEAVVRVQDFLSVSHSFKAPGFTPDLIVGNPPYVSIENISPEVRLEIRDHFEAVRGRFDYYLLFMERAANVIAVDGRWCFITPDNFLAAFSVVKLRELLIRNGSIHSISRFSSHRLFGDVATVPAITVWDKKPVEPGDVVHLLDVSGEGLQVTNTDRVPHPVSGGSPWLMVRQDVASFIARMRASHPPLSSFVRRLSAGLATGYNPAFVIAEANQGLVEPELLHRTVGGRDIDPYRIKDRSDKLLVPYIWSDSGPELIDLKSFPLAAEWLGGYRESLEQRHAVRKWRKAWWDLHDPVTEPLHRIPKVLVPDLSRTNRFAFDDDGHIPQHSAYYLLPRKGVDGRVLAALLNSPAVELVMRLEAPRAKDGFLRYRRQFLLTLPIPNVDANSAERIRKLLSRRDFSKVNLETSRLFGVPEAPEMLARIVS